MPAQDNEVPNNPLVSDSLLTIFTYAPAGLGHLRVTDALFEGLPKLVKPLILGADDKRITWLHRVTSIHPLLRRIMEWVQQGTPQEVFTYFYRAHLRRNNNKLYNQLSLLIEQHLEKPQKVLVIATHFGLAHELASIKKRLELNKKIKLFLVVQVTDDTPQPIWFVPGADLIVVPSQETQEALDHYRRRQGFRPVKLKVLPYPLKPKLMKNLSHEEYANKRQQLSPGDEVQINLAIPISGAAVGLKYFANFVNRLEENSQLYQFFIISRFSPHTKQFLFNMAQKPSVQIYSAQADHKVVNYYEKVYQQEVISLEITKPSEQAFKVLLDPVQRGGAIMLFSEPVGRQEYDNLKFMRKHRLIPDQDVQRELWELAANSQQISDYLLNQARHWRGVLVPNNAVRAAEFVEWLRLQGVLKQMNVYQPLEQQSRIEVSDQGVYLFWKTVGALLRKSV
jgi:hypothetical protein